MNSRIKMDGDRFQFLGRRATKQLKTKPQRFVQSPRNAFRRSGSAHDPLLVLNMSIFNDDNGRSRIFNPVKARESN